MGIVARIVFSIVCVVAFNASAGADAGVFTFNPPDSSEFTGTVISERIRFLDGVRRSVDTTKISSYHLFTKTETGFEQVTQPVSIVSSRDGQVSKNPIFGILADTEITFAIDATGRALEVEGFEDIHRKVEEYVHPIAESLKRSLDPAAMARKELTEWNTRMEPLAGKPVKLGGIAYERRPYVLPNGAKAEYYVVVTLSDTSRTDGKLCAHVEYDSDTDPARLAERLGESIEYLADQFDLSDSAMAAPVDDSNSSQSSMQMLIEVETMLVHSEHSESETSLTVKDPDNQTHLVRAVETQDKVFTAKQDEEAR
jgi:hypothetical protein